MIRNLLWFVVLALLLWLIGAYLVFFRQPQDATALALSAVNGGADAAGALWSYEQLKSLFAGGTILFGVGLFAWLVATPLCRRGLRRWLAGSLAAMLLVATSGCKPYDKPEYATIDTAETAFMVPLEDTSDGQVKFQSVQYLEDHKVAVKRVRIPHRWSQEGRASYTGTWMGTVRLIKVNRSPVTREWTAEGGVKDQAIWIESQDSVGFSTGFTLTALIAESDAAQFLYWYPSGSLAQVMDSEVRARVQQVAGEVAAKYPLDTLRSRKQEIVDAVRKDVAAFFKERGITVTTVGMFGGMTYENVEIQKAIDATFIAQQEKVVNAAKLEAQEKANARIELEAKATAEKMRREAQGKADATIAAAKAEAEAIREVNRALGEGQGDAVLKLKSLDLEKTRIEKWTGQYPQFLVSGAHEPEFLLQVPPLAAQK